MKAEVEKRKTKGEEIPAELTVLQVILHPSSFIL
jgi:hypothetical protein